jgi:hypothetical protein
MLRFLGLWNGSQARSAANWRTASLRTAKVVVVSGMVFVFLVGIVRLGSRAGAPVGVGTKSGSPLAARLSRRKGRDYSTRPGAVKAV